MILRYRPWLFGMSMVLVALTPSRARAASYESGHGRFQGDLDLSFAAGAEIAKGGPALAAFARGFYLETAGLYGSYADSLGGDRPSRRALALGIALRPLFLPRWASDLEHGPAWLDLAIDSFTLDLGLFWDQRPPLGWRSHPGLEAALGFEFPLSDQAVGPFIGLSGRFRWDDSELAAPSADHALLVSAIVTLSWHTIIATHLVDMGDAARR